MNRTNHVNEYLHNFTSIGYTASLLSMLRTAPDVLCNNVPNVEVWKP